MTVKAQKPIVIFRGDNTAAFDLRTITILLTGDLDLSHATAKFTLLDFSKTWAEQEVATGELSIVFTAEQTKAFALGPQAGTLRLYDMSTGTPRQLTIVNKIPFFVTNRVCEIDSQSYEADVCVPGGDVIHIEFKVGAGAVEGKADKVKNATTGDLASLTADGNLEDSGIPKTDVLRKSQMDSTPTAGSQNPVTSDGIKQAIDAATPSDYAQVKEQVQQNTSDITGIEAKIPAQASAQNQLADKNFVNSSIATNTATFRGSYNLVSDLGLTVSATEQQVAAAIATKLASLVPPVVPENNDYVFVQVPKTDADPTVIDRVDRYKCTVTESGGVTTRVWDYEWSLNNSSFTADQWAAINSGITSGAVEKLAGIEAGAQVNTVTGVKGNAEQDYRTGNINLTPANIGALGNSGAQTLNGTLTVGSRVLGPAKGRFSVTEGSSNTASGDYSHAEGYYTTANNDFEHAQGRFNDSHKVSTLFGNAGNTLSSIGFGTAANFSKNAVETMQDGKTFIYGLGGYDGTNPTGTGIQDLTTAITNKAPLASPAFTGTPTAPTPTTGDNSTKVATTAFVKGAVDGKADSNAIAEEFSSSSTYAIGDVVMHEGFRYKCETAVSTPGEWNLMDWEQESVQAAMGGITPGPDNTKLDSVAAAPDYDSTATYAEGAYVTYLGKLYYAKQAITTVEAWTAAHWQETDMTTPDATLDVTSAGSLRVVSAGGQTLWQQGYDLKTTSSATLANEAVNKYDFAANASASVSVTLPTPPTGKVGDFVLDVTNPALDSASFTQSAFSDAATYAVGDEVIYDSKIWRCVTAVSTAGAWTGTTNWEEAWPYFSIAGLGSTVEMVVAEGENLTDILSFAPGTKCELYFTLTSFAVDSHPTWKVVRQDVEVVA